MGTQNSHQLAILYLQYQRYNGQCIFNPESLQIRVQCDSQGSRALPPIPVENPPQEEYCDMDNDDDDDDDEEQTYEEVEVSPIRTHKPAVVQMRPNSHYMKKVVARAVSLIDYRPGPRDPPGSLKLKVRIISALSIRATDLFACFCFPEGARG